MLWATTSPWRTSSSPMRRSPAINNIPTQQEGHSRKTQSPLGWKTTPDLRGNMPQKAPESLIDASMASTAPLVCEPCGANGLKSAPRGFSKPRPKASRSPSTGWSLTPRDASAPWDTAQRNLPVVGLEVQKLHWPRGTGGNSHSIPTVSSPSAKAQPGPPEAELSQTQPRRG